MGLKVSAEERERDDFSRTGGKLWGKEEVSLYLLRIDIRIPLQ